MLGGSSTAAATLSTTTSSATSCSPPATRPSRLRGLSYLRNYTHSHLHSSATSSARHGTPPLARTQSSPVERSLSSPDRTPTSPTGNRTYHTPSPQRALVAGNPTTGWLPIVGGNGETSTATPRAQPASAATSSVEAGPPANMAGPEQEETAAASIARIGTHGAGGEVATGAASGDRKDNMPSIRLIPHTETRSSRPSLAFPIINRQLTTHDAVVRVGRYSERDNHSADALTNPYSNAPVGFKSKVVSRRHCEFWCSNNQWFVKDVKSSSGTFLNHVRLSSPGVESRPFPINDGDIVQLGIDFKGGEEVIFRCVKIRVECNRGWQKAPNPFSTSTHKRLKNLAKLRKSPSRDSDAQSVNTSECAICLNPVAPCQALFVAPCSHVWHYKCIRNIIYPKWPSFQCPNCRAYADLDAEVEQPELEDSDDEFQDALAASEAEANGAPKQDSSADDTTTTTGLNGPVAENHEPSTPSSTSGAATSNPIPTGVISRSANASSIFASTSAPVNERPGSLQGLDAIAANDAADSMPEGPATPRNDAGPFVLESAPRSNGRRSRDVESIARTSLGNDSVNGATEE